MNTDKESRRGLAGTKWDWNFKHNLYYYHDKCTAFRARNSQVTVLVLLLTSCLAGTYLSVQLNPFSATSLTMNSLVVLSMPPTPHSPSRLSFLALPLMGQSCPPPPPLSAPPPTLHSWPALP